MLTRLYTRSLADVSDTKFSWFWITVTGFASGSGRRGRLSSRRGGGVAPAQISPLPPSPIPRTASARRWLRQKPARLHPGPLESPALRQVKPRLTEPRRPPLLGTP